MPRVSDSTLEEIRQRTDIVALISSHGVALKRAGLQYKACCPFHNEKTPSFTVSPNHNSYHCFGCGAHGDVFRFLMESEGLTFPEAVKTLAEKAGVKIDTSSNYADISRKLLLEINAQAALFFRRCLEKMSAAQSARDYLASRRLSAETREKFCIGFAPNATNIMEQWAAKHNYKIERLVEAGLVIPGTDYRDRFINRIMFPIRDSGGKIVGFSGRALNKEAKAKYLNTPETQLFRKGEILYAFDLARANISKAPRREALVCEGQIDVIRCHEFGFETAVAAEGTAFTAQHALLLKRSADAALLLFDGDNAGRKAALRTGAILLAQEMPVRVATLPQGEDPDSILLTKGAETFQKILDDAVSFGTAQVRLLAANEPDPQSLDATKRITAAIIETAAACPSAVIRERLLEEAAAELGVEKSALQEDLKRAKDEKITYPAAREKSAANHTSAPQPPSPPIAPQPRTFSAATPFVASKIPASLCELLFQNADNSELLAFVKEWLRADEMLPAGIERTLIETLLAGGQDAIAEMQPEADAKTQARIEELIRAPEKLAHNNDSTPRRAAEDILAKLWSERIKKISGASPIERATILRRLRQNLPWEKRTEGILDFCGNA